MGVFIHGLYLFLDRAGLKGPRVKGSTADISKIAKVKNLIANILKEKEKSL